MSALELVMSPEFVLRERLLYADGECEDNIIPPELVSTFKFSISISREYPVIVSPPIFTFPSTVLIDIVLLLKGVKAEFDRCKIILEFLEKYIKPGCSITSIFKTSSSIFTLYSKFFASADFTKPQDVFTK